jgi:membrane-associated protein
MDLPFLFIDLVLHIDKYLPGIIESYGFWTYLILFAIIFCETGLVVAPYLPGDSLLFVAGTLAGAGYLNIEALIVILLAAAILGDTLNYWIGNRIGLGFFCERYPNLVRKEYIDRTNGFFEKYGGATIFVARFVPLVRTFAPCLAGIGTMQYRRFLIWNVLGAIAWSFSLVLAGYYLGTFSIVKENMSLLMIGVILLSLGTIIFIIGNLVAAYLKRKKEPDKASP